MSMVETNLRKLIHDKLIMPVPPGWTAELDVEHFDETLGEPEDESYYEAAEAHVACNEVLLDGVVNAGIGFYLRRLGRAL